MTKKYSKCWLPDINDTFWIKSILYNNIFKNIFIHKKIKNFLSKEIKFFINKNLIKFTSSIKKSTIIFYYNKSFNLGEYCINYKNKKIFILSKSNSGFMYSLFYLFKLIQLKKIKNKNFFIREKPNLKIRMINHLDNLDGSIKNNHFGNSIFFFNNNINFDLNKINFYAKLLTSIGINYICINNDDVNIPSTYLITKKLLIQLYEIYKIFNKYNIKLFISVNYKSPIILGNLSTFDPLNKKVIFWWNKKIKNIYKYIPKLGGLLVKINLKNNNDDTFYKRNHAECANVIAKPLKSFNGLLIWKCSTNQKQNWRNKKIDRACFVFNNFKKLDKLFLDNIILQIKSGPIGYQITEPISPLLGSMLNTSQLLELQITKKHTKKQTDICWLLHKWKNILNFNVCTLKKKLNIKKLVSGKFNSTKYYGITAISNISNNFNWTRHEFDQSNLFGYGKILWNLDINLNSLLKEWIKLSFKFNKNNLAIKNIRKIIFNSSKIYENYTSILGLNFMINKNDYGPNIDGYEYSNSGIYHYSNRYKLGVNRIINNNEYINQYSSENKNKFSNLNKCPEKLILFFYNLPYKYILKRSKKNIIQYIYDKNFKSVNEINKWIFLWKKIKNFINYKIFKNIKKKIKKQYLNSCEWRDQINTYFFRKSGIKDIKKRKIYS